MGALVGWLYCTAIDVDVEKTVDDDAPEKVVADDDTATDAN